MSENNSNIDRERKGTSRTSLVRKKTSNRIVPPHASKTFVPEERKHGNKMFERVVPRPKTKRSKEIYVYGSKKREEEKISQKNDDNKLVFSFDDYLGQGSSPASASFSNTINSSDDDDDELDGIPKSKDDILKEFENKRKLLRINSPNKTFDQVFNQYKDDFHEETVKKKSAVSSEMIDIDLDKRSLLDKYTDNKTKLKQETMERFKNRSFPSSTSKKRLRQRIQRYLHIIPQILSGKESSEFYGIIKEYKKKSDSDSMTAFEFMKVDLSQLSGGYYGLSRQKFISSEIKTKYFKELAESTKKNATIKFWSVDSFTSYVLANEMIARLVQEDFKCDILKAYDIMNESADYGKYVTDDIELEEDIDFEANEESKEFMRGLKRSDTKDGGFPKRTKIEEDPSSQSVKDSSRGLFKMLDSSFDQSVESSSDEEDEDPISLLQKSTRKK